MIWEFQNELSKSLFLRFRRQIGESGENRHQKGYLTQSLPRSEIYDEIIPFVNDNYPLSENKADYAISGFSYGGLAAIYVAFEYPDMFKHVLSLSGSVHYGIDDEHELLIKKIAFAEPRDIVLKLYVGKLEGEYHWNSPTWANQFVSHRHLETILNMKGYDFTYQEYAGDHGNAAWFEPRVEGISEFFKV